MQGDRKQLFAQCLITFGEYLACRNCILYSKKPSWYSANQWENSFKKMKKHFICTCLNYTSLSYAHRVSIETSFALILKYKVSLFYESYMNLFKNSGYLKNIMASPKRKMEAGQKDRIIKKKNPPFMISSASLSLWKMHSGLQGSSQLSNHVRLQHLQKTTKCVIQMKG